MGMLSSEELMPLRDALDELMEFVDELYDREIPYFYRFLDYMKNNIEICLHLRGHQKETKDELEHLEKILRRDWKNANDKEIGIPAYDFFCGKEESGMGLKYLELIEEVGQYLTEC